MKKTIAVLLTVLLILPMLSGCFGDTNTPPESSRPQINPNEDAANKEKVSVTLYFAYNDEFLLAGEPRVIEAPVNGRLEAAVIKALIEGPSPDNPNLKPLLDPGVVVESIKDSGEYLFVTFNSAFLAQANALSTAEARQRMQLAVYSIVNTLVELGGYSSVQLNADPDGSGVGQRIKKSALGFEGTGDLEPMGMNNAIVLNPRNTVNEFLKAYANKDYERVYSFIAYHDVSGAPRPAEDEFLTGVVSFNSGIQEYSIIDYYMAADGLSSVVMVNFLVKTKNGGDIQKNNVPIKLINEENIWRISYESFLKIFKSNI